MSNHKDLQNCFLDLKRAATSFYLNPKGKSWQIFLDHARQILEEKKDFGDYITKLKDIKEKAVNVKKREIVNLADKMLTHGIILRICNFEKKVYNRVV